MWLQTKPAAALIAVAVSLVSPPLWAQGVGHYLAPLEEVQAIVDEAHRMGLKVACHAYGGEGMRSCINAGVDAPNHLMVDSPA